MYAHFLMTLVLLSFSLNIYAQQGDWAEDKKMLRAPGASEAIVDSYGVKGPARQAMIDYFREIYANDELLDYVFKQADAKKIPKGKNRFEYSRRLGSEIAWALASKGITRLSPEDQRRYFAIEYEIMSAMSPRECQKRFDGAETDIANIAQIYDLIPVADLKPYFTIFRKAMLAELRDYPKRKAVSEKELERAQASFASKFESVIREDNVDQSVVDAIDDIAAADPNTGCQAGKLILKTVLAMKGRTGEVMIRDMLEEE